MSPLSRILLGAHSLPAGSGKLLLWHRAAPSARKRPAALLQARTRELSELSTHLLNFAEQERSELAHNLHDELGGLLTAAKMDLSWLQSRVGRAAR